MKRTRRARSLGVGALAGLALAAAGVSPALGQDAAPSPRPAWLRGSPPAGWVEMPSLSRSVGVSLRQSAPLGDLATRSGALAHAERGVGAFYLSWIEADAPAPDGPAAIRVALDRVRHARLASSPDAQSTEELVLRRQAMVETANAAPGIYSFRVLTLQVVFTNSEIVDFTSKIILTITQWFGDSVELEGYENDPVLRNSILLFGSYENHNGVPFYTFQGTGRFRFNATSQVLAYVEIVKAQFHTLENEDNTVVSGEELVQSLFSLWGYLSFKVLPDLDTMSFGNDADDTSGFTRGLYCANIGVGMSFTLRENEQPVPEFVFDAARMAFDLSLSYARPASLFKKFPFRVTKVESSDGDRKPADAGYLPVITPALKTVPLQAEWYGLFFALNLGSMGALAENAGS